MSRRSRTTDGGIVHRVRRRPDDLYRWVLVRRSIDLGLRFRDLALLQDPPAPQFSSYRALPLQSRRSSRSRLRGRLGDRLVPASRSSNLAHRRGEEANDESGLFDQEPKTKQNRTDGEEDDRHPSYSIDRGWKTKNTASSEKAKQSSWKVKTYRSISIYTP